ncbi:hypothetical protein BDM02DRAFT_3071548, partial [Thelephora ganbajun]
LIIGMTWLQSHNPEIDWKTGKIQFRRCPISCQGQLSSNNVLHNLVEQTIPERHIPTYFNIQEINHRIQAKEHAATTWVIEDLKDKKTLSIEDIKAGPLAEFVDVFEEASYQDLP